jgi:hypothetical protein
MLSKPISEGAVWAFFRIDRSLRDAPSSALERFTPLKLFEVLKTTVGARRTRERVESDEVAG